MQRIITRFFIIIILLVITLAIVINTACSGIATKSLTGRIVFVSNRDGNQQIYIMNADGTNQTRLTKNSATDANPKPSADGKKIVFDSNRDGNPEIYVMNADGSSLVQLTFDTYPDIPALSESCYTPVWSMDGTRMAFLSLVHGNLQTLYVMNADGSNRVKIAQAGMVSSVGVPTWSADNVHIAFSQSHSPSSGIIQIVNCDGTNLVSCPNHSLDYAPSYSPNGSKIAFCTTHDGNNQIYIMNADGTGQIRITNDAAEDSYPSWCP